MNIYKEIADYLIILLIFIFIIMIYINKKESYKSGIAQCKYGSFTPILTCSYDSIHI